MDECPGSIMNGDSSSRSSLVNPDTLRRFLRKDRLGVAPSWSFERQEPTRATMYTSRPALISETDRLRPRSSELVSVIILLIGKETGVSVRNLRSKYAAVLPLESELDSGSGARVLRGQSNESEVSDESFRFLGLISSHFPNTAKQSGRV